VHVDYIDVVMKDVSKLKPKKWRIKLYMTCIFGTVVYW
jgi:hypothetical protein